MRTTSIILRKSLELSRGFPSEAVLSKTFTKTRLFVLRLVAYQTPNVTQRQWHRETVLRILIYHVMIIWRTYGAFLQSISVAFFPPFFPNNSNGAITIPMHVTNEIIFTKTNDFVHR